MVRRRAVPDRLAAAVSAGSADEQTANQLKTHSGTFQNRPYPSQPSANSSLRLDPKRPALTATRGSGLFPSGRFR